MITSILRRTFDSTPMSKWGLDIGRPERSRIKYFRVRKDPADILTAVEIEAESTTITSGSVDLVLSRVPECAWVQEQEGSLRNGGFEIVFRKPLPYPDALRALSQALPLLDGAKSTFRAAVHTHFNVQDFTREQYVKLCIAYALVEPYIYSVVGNGRDESVFCVPWYKSSSSVRSLMKAYSSCDTGLWSSAINSFPKYSGLNLSATGKYGSVEFRHLQTPAGGSLAAIGAIADYMQLCKWVIDSVRMGESTSLQEFTELMYERMSDYGYTSDDNRHISFVYSLLAAYQPIDPLVNGFSIETARTIYSMISPNWARSIQRMRRDDRSRRPTIVRMPYGRGSMFAARNFVEEVVLDDIGEE